MQMASIFLPSANMSHREDALERYRMLVIFEENERIPLYILRHLWGLADKEAEATRTVEYLASRFMFAEGGLQQGFVGLSDLQRDLVLIGSRDWEFKGWHRRMLRQYCAAEIGTRECPLQYWRSTDGGQRFMRHLKLAALEDGRELKASLLDFACFEIDDAGAASLAAGSRTTPPSRRCILKRTRLATRARRCSRRRSRTTPPYRRWNSPLTRWAPRACRRSRRIPPSSAASNNNPMGDAGVASLALALENNATLQTLDPGFNAVSSTGAASLCRRSRTTPLSRRDLEANLVGAEGAASLAAVLERNAPSRR